MSEQKRICSDEHRAEKSGRALSENLENRFVDDDARRRVQARLRDFESDYAIWEKRPDERNESGKNRREKPDENRRVADAARRLK